MTLDAELQRIFESGRPAPLGGPAAAVPVDTVGEWRPFPFDLLPEPLRNFVAEGAEAMGCDPAYVALPALAAIASAIGTTRRIRLKRAWAEPPVIWAAIVGYSGTLKSPAQDHALAALKQLQADRIREHTEAIETYERARTEKPEEPTCIRYLVSDATVEALAPILQQNPRGVLLCRDELAGWLGSFDQYRAKGKGGDAAQWLEMHRAGHVLIDRKTGTPRTVHIPLAAVSIAGTIQPETLRRALGREHFENGLAARLLFAMPPRRRKRWTEADVSARTTDRFASMLGGLLTLKHNVSDDGDPVPVDVQLDDSGHKAWVEFYNEHADRQAAIHDGDLAAAFSKLEAYAARFALIFHFVRWAAEPTFSGDTIGADSVRAGVQLARWFCHETERVYGILAEADEHRENLELVQYIRSRDGSVTVRELQRGTRQFRGSAETVRARLDGLVEAGLGSWDRPAPGGDGGRPIEVFRLHGDTGDGDKTPVGRPET